MARTEGHCLRRKFAAIIVGANTVINDDPLLTVRHVEGPNPVRIVLDGDGRVPLDARIFSEEGRTIVATAVMSEGKETSLRERDVKVWRLPNGNGKVDLQALLPRIAKEGLDSLLIEGGGETAAAFLESCLVDKVSFFIAPLIIGGRAAIPAVGGEGARLVSEGLRLKWIKIEWIGEDLLLTGYPEARGV